MKRVGLLGIAFLTGALVSQMAPQKAAAVGICKCDNAKGFQASCLPICKQANEKTSFFRPAVYFGDDKKVNSDKTPLNGTSMKFLFMPASTRYGMEKFRRFLEENRNLAEKDYRDIKAAYLRGHVGPEEFDEAEILRDEALVNYQHGMRAYLNTPSPR